MKKNLLDAAVREELIARLRRLTPDTPRRWGTMTASQMLAHLSDAFLMGLNRRPCADISNFLTRSVVKWIALSGAKLPKNVRTAKELDQKKSGTPPEEWAGDLQKFLGLIADFAQTTEATEMGRHPLFGKMSHKEWGRLAYLHTDHHLLQFGV